MKQCGSCKHWKRPAVVGWDGTCRLLSADENGYTPQSGEPLAVAHGQELPAWLDTKPEFGCVLWEEGVPGG